MGQNTEHHAIVIDGQTEDCEIVGVLVGALVGAPRSRYTLACDQPTEEQPRRRKSLPDKAQDQTERRNQCTK